MKVVNLLLVIAILIGLAVVQKDCSEFANQQGRY